MKVFIDTSAILAVMHAEDEKHQAAVEVWETLIRSGERPTASNYVVLESVSLIQRRYGMEAVRRFVGDMLSAIEVLWVDETAHAAALIAVLYSSSRSGPGMVDCTSFEILRRYGFDCVFAYDRHFPDLGFNLL